MMVVLLDELAKEWRLTKVQPTAHDPAWSVTASAP